MERMRFTATNLREGLFESDDPCLARGGTQLRDLAAPPTKKSATDKPFHNAAAQRVEAIAAFKRPRDVPHDARAYHEELLDSGA